MALGLWSVFLLAGRLAGGFKEAYPGLVSSKANDILIELAQRVEETIRRAGLYAQAGADGLFVPGLREPTEIEDVALATRLPLNVMAWGGLPAAAELSRLGVRRLSAGSAISQLVWGQAERAARSFLETGHSDPLSAGSKPFAEMQQLFAAAR